MHIYTVAMKIFVTSKKVERIRRLSKKILLLAQNNQRLVPASLLRSFCGVCVSVSLALPLERFYTGSLFSDLSRASDRARYSGPVRLTRQSLRDLSYLRALTRGGGRDMNRVPYDLCLHADAADVGYGV